MKNRNNKKKIIITAIIVYFLVIGFIYIREVTSDNIVSPSNNTAAEEAYNRKKAVIDAKDEEEKNAYNKALSALDYDISKAAIQINPSDCLSVMTANNLPALSRMAEEDSQKYMSELQVLKKIERLGIDTTTFETPELNWKNLYNRVTNTMASKNTFANQLQFIGLKASELNKFIRSAD
ncbi:MAG: hypothetical protein J5981_06845, partial [Lachnospira sp.]|nr:hypothetical protein [Lachnospira sp.]